MNDIPEHLRPQSYRKYVRQRRLLIAALLLWAMLLFGASAGRGTSSGRLLVMLVMTVVGLRTLTPFLRKRLAGVRRLRTVHRLTREGHAHLTQGDAVAAFMAFDQAARHSQGLAPFWHCMSVHNVGVALLRTGEPERATVLMEAAWGSGAFEGPLMRRHHAAFCAIRAAAYAVAGQLAEAEQALVAARSYRSKLQPGRLLLAEVLVAARREDAQAAADLAMQWEQAERDLMPIQRRGVRLLLAFMAQRSGRPEAELSMWLGGLHPMPPGSLDYLSVRWPALKEFMQSRGLLV